MKHAEPHTLDVRPFFEQGRDPFTAIMAAKAVLQEGQEFRLIAPFEPVPLLELFEAEGYRVESVPRGPGEWFVRFIPGDEVSNGLHEVDLRTLEPPEPLHRALEAITQLGREQTLALRTRFRPAHLFEQLEEGHFDWECEEVEQGHWLTHVWRKVLH